MPRVAVIGAGIAGLAAAHRLKELDVTRHERVMPQYCVGHPERVQGILARLERWWGLALAGNAYSGVGIPHCIRGGEQAADRIAAELCREGPPKHSLSSAGTFSSPLPAGRHKRAFHSGLVAEETSP